MRSHRCVILGAAACFGLLVLGTAIAAPPMGSRAKPYPVRRAVKIPGSDGWKLRVNKSIPNATSQVLKENMFNDAPAAGRQFYMINVTATYTGKGKSSEGEGLTLSALGKSNVAYDYEDGCGVVPAGLEQLKDVYTGGSITGNVCFSVRKTDIASLLLVVEPAFSLDDVTLFFRTR